MYLSDYFDQYSWQTIQKRVHWYYYLCWKVGTVCLLKECIYAMFLYSVFSVDNDGNQWLIDHYCCTYFLISNLIDIPLNVALYFSNIHFICCSTGTFWRLSFSTVFHINICEFWFISVVYKVKSKRKWKSNNTTLSEVQKSNRKIVEIESK